MRRQGFHTVIYLNNFVSCETSLARAREAFNCLPTICDRLGFCLAPDNCITPASCLIWLGFEVCSEHMRIRIPNDKLWVVLDECSRWLARLAMTRRAL